MQYRFCTPVEAPLLAPLNLQLIRDEGHSNPMDVAQLAERMHEWLEGDYRAVVFEEGSTLVGYALYRTESGYVMLRQLFVSEGYRRRGIARDALAWLRQNAWPDAPALRVEVLVDNAIGRAFWRSVGLVDYAVIMEGSLCWGGDLVPLGATS